jgi:IS30 family transposase/DNA-binding CsgD family transcriptional regulator
VKGLVLMGGRRVDPARERAFLELVASGMTPRRAAGIAGVAVSTAYALDRRVNGVARLAAKRAAATVREAQRAARGDGRRVGPERERRLLDLLASGMTANKAAGIAGVSASWAYAVNKKMGGVYRPPSVTYSDRYLSREERYEIARLRDCGLGVRAIAARAGRSPSTISRELRRNADPRTGGYQPERAHRLAWERQRRPKPSRISASPRLRAAVQGMLDRRYSPQQASGRLKVLHPGDPDMQVSHETVYQSIYVYPRGELRKELQASLRAGRSARRPRGRQEKRGKIIGAVPIGQRPPEAEGRLVPGHHEGDLVMGSAASNSAVATIVERMTGYLTLLPLPGGHGADAVADAVIARMTALPAWFARTLTWDNGTEMARHARITDATGINVYFADPYSPWQRGSNENINGLLREYLPKGTDLRLVTPEQLQAIQDELNDRPRKRFGYRTPREELDRLLAEDQRVATTP